MSAGIPSYGATAAGAVGKVANVLPNWWAFSFVGLQAAALLPLAAQYFFTPLAVFADIIPPGIDKATDGLQKSLRVEIANKNAAHSYLMIAALFIGCTLFARNSLAGQPVLQQRLVKLPIYCGLASDLWLYGIVATKIPSHILFNVASWTPSMKGMIFGLPAATLLKLVWLFGIGRDVV